MPKLLILPGACDALGGTLVTLSLLVKGFESCGASQSLCALVQSGSVMEKYLKAAGQGDYLQIIESKTKAQFLKQALGWVSQQPKDCPLFLDNCVERSLISTIALAAPALRLSGRAVYHFCHDLALSYNYLGYIARKIAFSCLAPKAICNSEFTAGYISHLMSDIRGILYQPVDGERFNDQVSVDPPLELRPILRSGSRVILTPSRIKETGVINDKNLPALIPMLVHLKAMGQSYHAVVIGEDKSPDRIHSRNLVASAEQAGVSDCFSILPPTFAIENYYKHADVVVTLAPREPFGRTVVEAIACGVPVVGSNTGGIGEILQHFAPAWTVDPNDPMAAAETIVRVATDPNTPNILNQGIKWVKAECSVEGYARSIMRITNLAPVTPIYV